MITFGKLIAPRLPVLRHQSCSAQLGGGHDLKQSVSEGVGGVNLDPRMGNREDWERKAKSYCKIKRTIGLATLCIGSCYLAFLLTTGASQAIARSAAGLFESPWAIVLLYIVVVGCAGELLLIPLGYYSGYALEHKYELSNEGRLSWLADELKAFGIGLLLAVLALEVVYFLLRAYPEGWWFVASVFFLFCYVALAYAAPVLLMPRFFRFTPLQNQELKDRLLRLAERAGAKAQDVYEMDMSRKSKAANAALAGLGNTRRIILSDTLVEHYTEDEIETVLGHELGHHVHHHLWKLLLAQWLVTLGGLCVAGLLMQRLSARFGLGSVADVAGLPLLILAVGGVSLIVLPLINTYSRSLERVADSFSVRVTGKPEALAAAMLRLAEQNLSEMQPHPAIEVIFYGHPAVSKRIEAAHAVLAEEATP